MRLILILTMTVLSLALHAKVVKPVLDNDLSHRYDSEFGKTDRSVAGEKPEQDDQVKEDSPQWVESDQSDEYSDDDSSRDPSAAGDSSEQENRNGIRYWKY